MKTIIIKNNYNEDFEIPDLLNYLIPASGTEIISEIFDQEEISNSSFLIEKVAGSVFTVSNGLQDLTPLEGVHYCLHNIVETTLTSELRDRSGKLRVHQTSRKLGTTIMWTGEGDDQLDPHSVGEGETLAFGHFAGDTTPLVKYIDFNVVSNETWMHEGYITWCKCKLDTLNLSIVPRVTSTVTSNNTNYNLYGGYLIIPAVPGTGTVEITSDITTHSGGLVYIPNNDLDENPTAFWNADWNTSTKRYENITAAPAGNGRYNMFSLEITIAKFVRSMPLLDSGFIALNSSDTDQLGHGIRLKMEATTNTTISGVGDHDWSVACTLCLHRKRSV
jgi:hypothetical protein